MRTLEEIIERMKKKTIEEDGHWLFTGAQNKGQGVIGFNYKMIGVHRLSAAYYLGYDLNDPVNQVNHKIICTYKHCWIPDHLYIGTQQDNILDNSLCENINNQNKNKTHCKYGHEFTPENTYIKKGGRQCKQCTKDYDKQYKEFYGV